MEILIRNAINNDLQEIIDILNQAIRTRKLVGFTKEFNVEEREEWFLDHSQDNYPILIAECNNKILGWISISPYRKGREALDKTVEVSCFIHTDYQRQGIGNKLLSEILKISKNSGKTNIIAILFNTNIGSSLLLEKHKFEIWGVLPEVAELDGVKFNHVYYGKKLF
ncbi:MAG: N-acetyltransferase [Spirochaetae bacterium HGW-Spirochaetae-1]|jgi:phosphinothricin acetyltransferase|nr:MAG: N-acetyltransferase [Spirochaetae bacterium HGW-Spirochaetae-1]